MLARHQHWATLQFVWSKVRKITIVLRHATDQAADEANNHIVNGRHADSFRDVIGKTQFIGTAAPANFIWKAKGMSADCYGGLRLRYARQTRSKEASTKPPSGLSSRIVKMHRTLPTQLSRCD